MLELYPRLGAREAPVNGTFDSVALGLPRGHLSSKRPPLWDAAICQALAPEHRELYLSHVQPRAVLWGVVDLQLLAQAPGLDRIERLLKGGGGVGV
jgi:hypothetical protein